MLHAQHNSAHSQTIYGELISLESNSDALGLAMFVLQRLLWNPDIAAQFRHAKVPHLYKDGNLKVSSAMLSEPESVRVAKKSGMLFLESKVIKGVIGSGCISHTSGNLNLLCRIMRRQEYKPT